MVTRLRLTCRWCASLLIVALAATGGTGAASAVPPPPNPSDEEIQTRRDDARVAAARVGRLASQASAAGEAVTVAQLDLAATYRRVTVAQQRHRTASTAATTAERRATQARVELEAATRHISRVQRDVDAFVAGSYRQGSTIGSITAYAGAETPEDLLTRAQLLNAVGSAQLDALEEMRRARIEKSNFDAAERAALREAALTRRAAEEADTEARSAYAAAVDATETARRRNSELAQREQTVRSQLAEAQRALSSLNGQRSRYDDWREAREEARRKREQEAKHVHTEQIARPQPHSHDPVVGARVVAPTTGVITSTYGPRWGSIHYGLDIANSIGTPVVSVMDGNVVSSGPATGFGLWVRVQHDNGTITVYGHINETLVSVGQRVRAGQQIATVGNRGQSTGPHLHFEVHQRGMKIDPLIWLRRNGVAI